MSTTWSPDTCGCRVTYDPNTDGEPVVKPTGETRYCADHQAHRGRPADLLGALLDENRLKNRVYAVAEQHGVALEDYGWRYTLDRTGLIVRFPKLSRTNRTTLEAELTGLFGDQVTVEE